uniref:TLC domain-containing protein n=1 Tax=Grammatophora oceanica TaxID=210454 RepID=A0A7S1UV81_9STRA|mmetsp:Transcript_25295/g.36978  ORF Transcript_25295/g.36978 Transcript_25295/m.36978 type:complete len:275 (+) Transcript_25295:88-912(+)|eukprot:CAMPEP_0194049530 /NCGR_PEP_ID=MMETSP0009_2-20130614/30737_1 /TAXON_ID=210454 /ORGANISM="Grammatophora oceanica, Strain CCMP 410" /LENGTH=274 /DNA_ID=CAMNT_0038695709 /DNA_START=63 /DNA_END=887 /DNA_ORIENTATION=+
MLSSLLELISDPVVLGWGLGCTVVQGLSYLLFSKALPDGPWKKQPSFTAHQFVAFIMMVYCFAFGAKIWFIDPPCEDCIFDVSEQGLFLSKIVIGGMLFWDIPVGLVSDGLGDPIMLAHHVGLLLVASLTYGVHTSQPIGTCYAAFFFGVIELSSIPLAIVDIFHPKQVAWHDWHKQYPFIMTLNELSRVVFVLLYFLTRMVYFPYMALVRAIPDYYGGISKTDETGVKVTLWSIVVFCVLFTCLQLYWGSLIIRQVQKALAGDKPKTDETKKD